MHIHTYLSCETSGCICLLYMSLNTFTIVKTTFARAHTGIHSHFNTKTYTYVHIFIYIKYIIYIFKKTHVISNISLTLKVSDALTKKLICIFYQIYAYIIKCGYTFMHIYNFHALRHSFAVTKLLPSSILFLINV